MVKHIPAIRSGKWQTTEHDAILILDIASADSSSVSMISVIGVVLPTPSVKFPWNTKFNTCYHANIATIMLVRKALHKTLNIWTKNCVSDIGYCPGQSVEPLSVYPVNWAVFIIIIAAPLLDFTLIRIGNNGNWLACCVYSTILWTCNNYSPSEPCSMRKIVRYIGLPNLITQHNFFVSEIMPQNT